MYIAILPKDETANKRTPIIVLPRSQRIALKPSMCDFDDIIFIFGTIHEDAWKMNLYGTNEPLGWSPGVQVELLWNTIQRIKDPALVKPLKENIKIRKPVVGKYMLKQNKAIIGTITGKNIDAYISRDGMPLISGTQVGSELNITAPTRYNPATIEVSRFNDMIGVINNPNAENFRRVQSLVSMVKQYR
jgi:hypothetical protein